MTRAVTAANVPTDQDRCTQSPNASTRAADAHSAVNQKLANPLARSRAPGSHRKADVTNTAVGTRIQGRSRRTGREHTAATSTAVAIITTPATACAYSITSSAGAPGEGAARSAYVASSVWNACG